MYVNAQQTLSLDLNRKVERVIRARRAEVVANSHYVRAQGALHGAAPVKEEIGVRGELPPLEGSPRSNRSGKEYGVEDGVEKEEEESDVTDVTDEKQKIEKDVSVERERKARARAAVMGKRLATRQLLTERRGANLAVFFLDPVSALEIDDDFDRDVVCHEHTLDGETMRYAIEDSEDMKTIMKIDALIVTSLKAIPGHVTAGVVTGNVFDRFERVVMIFDDVTRETIIEQIDASLSSLMSALQLAHLGSRTSSS